MANICLIMGKSGTGKSTSIKNLNPKETIVFNVLKKKLPFKGSSKLYNEGNKNLFNVDDYSQIMAYLDGINKNASYVKTIIIDDCSYLMRKEFFKTVNQTGYNKFTAMAAHFQGIIQTMENMREDLNIFLIMHCEEVMSDNVIVGYKASTVGKLVDSTYNPIEVVPMVLFSDIIYGEDKKPVYGFYTHRCVKGTVEIPAKSPADMFEEDFIPNDLSLIIKAMDSYYN
jgi:hypothetical protein